MSVLELGVAAIAALVVAALLLRPLVRWVSFPCQFCNTKVRMLKQVDLQVQEAILAYFRQHERREPDKGGVFVCTECKTVHDDFSGEKKSWDMDRYSCRTFCKVCGRLIRECEPERDKVVCPKCDTEYRWQVHERSGYRFFMPPAGAQLRAHAPGSLEGL